MGTRLEPVAPLLWVAPLLLLAVLWGGTADRPATLVVAGVGGLLAICRGLSPKRVPLSWFSLWLLLAVTLSVLQCLPLPAWLRGALSPGLDATLRLVLTDLGGYPAESLPLSLDPAESAHETVRLLGYLCLLWAWSTLRSRQGDSFRLAGLVVAAAVVVAGLGALAATGVPLPAPLAVPAVGASRSLWPAVLPNANHQAALLSVAAILCVGMLLTTSPHERRSRWLLLLGALLLLDVGLLMTLSRAGIGCGLIGQVVTLLLADTPDRATVRQRLLRGLLPALGLGLVVLLLGPGAHLVERLRDGTRLLTPGSKIWVWQQALPLLRSHLLLGIGRGAQETALTVPPEVAAQLRFTYLENEWLQTLLDFGVVAGMTLWALLLLAMWQSRQGMRPGIAPSVMRRSAWVALLYLGVHNFWDFNLEIGALAVPAVLLAALVQRPSRSISARWLMGPGVLTIVLSGWVHLRAPSHDQDGRHLYTLATDPKTPVGTLLAEAGQAVRRHPLDGYLSALVAARLAEDHHPDAMRWVNRALNQQPNELLAQATAARLLARHGHKRQALALLGPLVAAADPEKRKWLLQRLLEITTDPAEILRALPSRPELRAALLDDLGTSVPPRWPMVLVVARMATSLGEDKALAWLGRAALAESSVQDAERALRGLLTHGPGEPLLVGGLLELLLRHGQADLAEKLADEALAQHSSPEVRIAQAQILAAQHKLESARQSLQRAMDDCHDLTMLARIHEVRADLESQAGQVHRAAAERAEAERLRREAKQP